MTAMTVHQAVIAVAIVVPHLADQNVDQDLIDLTDQDLKELNSVSLVNQEHHVK
jgi:hypothetical protein